MFDCDNISDDSIEDVDDNEECDYGADNYNDDDDTNARSSSSVGFWPIERITPKSSFVEIVPLPSCQVKIKIVNFYKSKWHCIEIYFWNTNAFLLPLTLQYFEHFTGQL